MKGLPSGGRAAQKRLKEVLRYDPATGRWYWLVDRPGRRKRGDLAGCMDDGHQGGTRLRIRVDGRLYYASRLAVLYATGEWPKGVVDHWDRDTLNERASNLRDVTHSVNSQNIGLRSDNASGVSGVSWISSRKHWRASIRDDGSRQHLVSAQNSMTAFASSLIARVKRDGDWRWQ